MSAQHPLHIIIDGPPASGKGTQSEFIQALMGVIHISTGDALRAEVKNNTELGQRAKIYMEKGQLVPDDLIIDICLNRLRQPDCVQRGWLLDGFPRTGSQAKALSEAGLVPDLFIHIKVDDEECVRRISGRYTDPVTGIIYNLTTNPPPAEIRSRLTQRADDREEVIRDRLKSYHAQYDSVVQYFQGQFVEIDGKDGIESTSKQIGNTIIDCILRKGKV